MLKLFHGSNMSVPNPKADYGRDSLDFGKAFYLTDVQEQAEKWAHIVSSRKEIGIPTVSQYLLDDKAIIESNYRRLVFNAYDLAWLDFVCANRKGSTLWNSYDIIEGGIANDKVIDTVEAYIDGFITVEQALNQLRLHKPKNQIAIINQEIINRHLIFTESYTL